jgi:hypothetical protein
LQNSNNVRNNENKSSRNDNQYLSPISKKNDNPAFSAGPKSGESKPKVLSILNINNMNTTSLLPAVANLDRQNN